MPIGGNKVIIKSHAMVFSGLFRSNSITSVIIMMFMKKNIDKNDVKLNFILTPPWLNKQVTNIIIYLYCILRGK